MIPEKPYEKYYWKDEVLNTLKLSSNKYSIVELKNIILDKYSTAKAYKNIKYNKELWTALKLPKHSNQIRISVLLAYLSKYIIKNDRPNGIEYYSIDYDSKNLSDYEIKHLLESF